MATKYLSRATRSWTGHLAYIGETRNAYKICMKT